MNGNSEKSGGRSWLWTLLILLFIVGFIIWISIPNFVSNGHDKGMYIFYNLMQIDAAKNEWVLENGITNAEQMARLNRPLTEKELAPYLKQLFDTNGVSHSIAGEVYSINKLGVPPEAMLTRKVHFAGEMRAKGTVIRLTTNPANGFPYVIIPPNQRTNN